MSTEKHLMKERFRGYYPVVIDVETGGLNPETHALLEVSAVFLTFNDVGELTPSDKLEFKILPDERCVIDEKALKINKINMNSHQSIAISERDALKNLFGSIRKAIKSHHCVRGILAGHNAPFDLAFLEAASKRQGIKRNPFHPFSVIDTVSLSALFYGQTTLKNACSEAKISFNESLAHSSLYDAEKTAELLCLIHNEHKKNAAGQKK
jgi:ribonuclease T